MKKIATRSLALALVIAVWPAASAMAAATVTASNTQPVPGETVTFEARDDDVRKWDWGFYRGRELVHQVPAQKGRVRYEFPDYGEWYVVAHGRADEDDVYAYVRVRVDKVAASLSVNPAEPRTGETVTFTPAVELAPGRTAESYEWDFDGDGFDDGTGETATRTYSEPGSYSARVRVVNDWGTTAESAPVVFSVVSPPPPPPPPEAAPAPGNQAGSPAAPQQFVLGQSAFRLMDPRPFIRIKGRTTGRGARIDLFSVRAQGGATVSVRCKGKGCPVKVTRARIKGQKVRTVRLKAIERWLRAGIVLEVRVTKNGFVGRYTRFRIGRIKAPVRWDGCLLPGSGAPKVC